MIQPVINTLAVIGVGLIGGSFALALKQSGVVERVVGIDHDPDNLSLALRLGVIDEAAPSLAEGLSQAQVVFVAVPVRSIADVVAQVVCHVCQGCVITDGGSVKDEVVRACEQLMPPGIHFVGGHPIAGTEHSGAAASFGELYQNRRCILTPTVTTKSDALELVRHLWQAAGSRVELMDATSHDRIFAAVSHLPHMVAYTLVHAVDRSAEEEENIMAFSAGGFRDFTRIASSDPVMWRDIALMNRGALLDMLDRYALEFMLLRERIADGDAVWLEDFFQTSKRLRDGIAQR
jgi:prephenate dehydrogenase